MKFRKVPEDVFNEIVKFLAAQPYEKVAAGIQILQQCAIVDEGEKNEKEKSESKKEV